MQDWTLYGQIGFTDATEQDSGSDSSWLSSGFFVRGVSRHYFNNGDGKISGEVFFAHGEQSTGVAGTDDLTVFGWGVEAEHLLTQYSNGFLTAFARIDGYYVDEDDAAGGGADDDGHAYVFKVGITANWGYFNPQSRDLYGIAMDLPDISRINSLGRATD